MKKILFLRCFSTVLMTGVFVVLFSNCGVKVSAAQDVKSRINPNADATPLSKVLISKIPKNWVLYSETKLSESDLSCADFSEKVWDVSNEKEHVGIKRHMQKIKNTPAVNLPKGVKTFFQEKFKNEHIPTEARDAGLLWPHTIHGKDGWFLGFNFGEWGGSLWWLSPDGKTRKKLSDKNTIKLLETKSGIFVLEGLCHLSCKNGWVARLIKKNGVWQKKVLIDLKSTPQLYLEEPNDSFLVVTKENVVRVLSSGDIKNIYENQCRLVDPSSVTELSTGEIFIGLRHFVLGLVPCKNKYKSYWFVPEDCTQFGLVNKKNGNSMECKCGEKERSLSLPED